MTAPSAPTGSTSTTPRTDRTSFLRNVVDKTRDLVDSAPGLDYLMLRIVVFLLIGIGVIMVFSSSMATSYAENAGVWSIAFRQLVMVGAGLFLYWLALRVRPATLRKLVPWLLVLTFILLILVLIPGIGTGRQEVGSQSWIALGPVSLQPSELARVTIGLFGATVLANKTHRNYGFNDPFTIYGIIAGIMFALIFLQGDVGMAMSFMVVVLFTLFFAGVRPGIIGVIIAGGLVGAVGLLFGGGFRSQRFHTYFDALTGNISDTRGAGFQAYQGFLSLADGGFSGVGIGQSRAKWFYLPEAKNDFVYAIVGEELGWVGGAIVIVLFAALCYFGIRTALNSQNQFQALVAATLTAGVVAQALFNIGYVVGLLPVTGIQLPMISAGGTSAIITIASMGILANIARHEPMQISAMQNFGRPLFDRFFHIPEPIPAGEPAQGGRHAARRAHTTSVPQSEQSARTQRTRRMDPPRAQRERRFGTPLTQQQRQRPRAQSSRDNLGESSYRGRHPERNRRGTQR
ncbi:MAG: putative peptidoglycan glycosyltransferase FtsW [Corynebacterium sp.]|nr:putative peptidoglycan glycosyltransferase FtsW [Corynebacterium sp.]